MSAAAEEADKTTDASAGDEEEEWLYGDESESKDEDEEAKLNAAVSAPADASTEDGAAHATGNGVASEATGDGEGAGAEDVDSDSDSDDDDDDVRVTIGDIKTGAPQYTNYGAPPVNLNIKTTGSRPYGASKMKGVDLEAPGSINGVPVLEAEMESFEEKPWRKPGADLSDYFNYGFNEDTWKAYCEKQKRLRMGMEVSTVSSITSKITVQQGRTGNDKDISVLPVHTSKPDFSSPINMYKPAVNQVPRISPPQWPGPPPPDMSYYTKTSGTIDVIGGGTATISRVEGRRRHNLEGNNIQVISEQTDAEPTPAKIPTFFPPGPLPPNIPPPPFLPPPPNVNAAPPLIPPPRLPITVPPPGFPPPPSGPPPAIIPTMDSGHPGGYDGRSVPPYPFPQGAYPPPMAGGVPPPWPPMMDNSKPWDYYSRRDDKREKEREQRPRERTHEREREREHSPSAMGYTSEEERYRYREYPEQRGGYGVERHRERSSREKEERHRERRHREKEEGRHKSSRSSSRRRHDSEEGDSHRRHKHKKSKRSKEGKEASEEISADQENQEAME
ncbi:pre-mRNA 3'-end-processing factor FIP1 isoform X2 [Sebastes fasciatus]|uniref:pre-mRNA 3'-end-processing factor FIP1 isoform X2 n=1 Tax=Sebastes fasciatus TaxID=394691 RepID=UPI003D9F7F23